MSITPLALIITSKLFSGPGMRATPPWANALNSSAAKSASSTNNQSIWEQIGEYTQGRNLARWWPGLRETGFSLHPLETFSTAARGLNMRFTAC